MLKDIVGKIVEAEQTAENIEKQALIEAEQIKSQAIINAELLKSKPSQEVYDQRAKILLEAEQTAAKLASQKLEENKIENIGSKKIEKVAESIVLEFLKRGV